MSRQRVLDPCCGSRMFWFDKDNPEAIFGDIRRENGVFHDKRTGRSPLVVAPDVIADFTDLPFKDGWFNLVVFDPPHLTSAGKESWQALKYGKLTEEWRTALKKGFSECFRVPAENGTLIFKWSEVHVSLREVLSLTDVPPLFGQTTTVNLKTHWIVFMKPIEVK